MVYRISLLIVFLLLFWQSILSRDSRVLGTADADTTTTVSIAGQCVNGIVVSPPSTILNCTNRELRSVPRNLPRNLTHIYLSGNGLREIQESSFKELPELRFLRLDNNALAQAPTSSLQLLTQLEALLLSWNNISVVGANAFHALGKLVVLDLQGNQIRYIHPDAFRGLHSLQVLELNNNQLRELPVAVSVLPSIRELTLANNGINYLPRHAFRNNSKLTFLELKGNPIADVDGSAFSDLPQLKKLSLVDAKNLALFPNVSGSMALEYIRIDRSQVSAVPDAVCVWAPKLVSLILKSNKLSAIPRLEGCRDLRLLDLSYNQISFLGNENAQYFRSQSKLFDLILSYNAVTDVRNNALSGLSSLQVLDLEGNGITLIDDEAFFPLQQLRDLNLAKNAFPVLPTTGMSNLRQIQTHGNPFLKDFPAAENFPKIQRLALSYAYHCCQFLTVFESLDSSSESSSTEAKGVEETIVWLDSDTKDWGKNTSFWSRNQELWNFSSKLDQYANRLLHRQVNKEFNKDYQIPGNLAQYADEYFEDYKSIYYGDYNSIVQHPVQCLPLPTPFMPCEDLFGWWTLRCGSWMVFLLALLGNGVVVVVLSFGRNKIDVPRFLVCNLAMADLFMGIYLGILAVVDASTLGEFREYAVAWQTSWGCQVAGVLGVLSSELSVFTLAVITLERNYAITHAMHLNKRLSLKHASYIMSVGWLFSAGMALLPLLGVSDYRKFAVCLPFEVENSGWSLLYVVSLIVINGIAFLILMGCYLRMYCAIRGSQAWNSNDSRIAKRMALLVFTDFLCWAPIAFFTLTAVSGMNLVSLEEAKIFTIFVLPLNSCCNPFLYAIFTKQFKKDCAMLCKRIEESRVTRGIGRGRNSSNFSNRQTNQFNTNSAADKRSGGGSHSDAGGRHVCQCGLTLTPAISKERDVQVIAKRAGFAREGYRIRKVASRWFWGQRKNSRQDSVQSSSVKSSNITSGSSLPQRSSMSSENMPSSPSEPSWSQNRIPMRVIDSDMNHQEKKHASWSASRKKSADSTQTTSSTFKTTSTTRSSVSSSLSASKATDTTTLRSVVMIGDQSVGLTDDESRISQRVLTSCGTSRGFGRRRSRSRSGVPGCGNSPHDEKEQESSLPLCHECSLRRAERSASAPSHRSPLFLHIDRNKALQDKLKLYFEKLAVAGLSPGDPSPEQTQASCGTSYESGACNRENLSQSGGTAETDLSGEMAPQETGNDQQNPVIEIEPNSPTERHSPPSVTRSVAATDVFLSPEVDDGSSRSPSTASVRTQIPFSVSPDPDDMMLLSSGTGCARCCSATNSSLDIRRREAPKGGQQSTSGWLRRKVSSDTSLMRSIRRLPAALLRPFSSGRGNEVHQKHSDSSQRASCPLSLAADDEKRQPLLSCVQQDDQQRYLEPDDDEEDASQQKRHPIPDSPE